MVNSTYGPSSALQSLVSLLGSDLFLSHRTQSMVPSYQSQADMSLTVGLGAVAVSDVKRLLLWTRFCVSSLAYRKV